MTVGVMFGVPKMDETIWEIKDWSITFETADLRRRVTTLSWVSLPVKLDGRNYRRLVRKPGGIEAYAVFMALVQVAAGCDVRGVLASKGKPLTSEDLSILTDMPVEAIERSMQVLADKAVAWLVPSDPQRSPAITSDHQPTEPTRQDRTGQKGRTNQPTRQKEPDEPQTRLVGGPPIEILSDTPSPIVAELLGPDWKMRPKQAAEVARAGPESVIRALMADVGSGSKVRSPAAVLVSRVREGNLSPPRPAGRKRGLDDPEDIAARVKARATQ